jgi:hypothetical protein
MLRVRAVFLGVALIGVGCGSSAPPPAPAPEAKASTAEPAPRAKLDVSLEVRRAAPQGTACGAGDVCGHFLQVISPGSDPKALADHAVKLVEGKCGGHVIVYKDPRNVMGAGPVLATADEKRACEKALGRPHEDTDFPHAAVFRAAK